MSRQEKAHQLVELAGFSSLKRWWAWQGLNLRPLRCQCWFQYAFLPFSGVAFALLPDRFTLRALRDVHEAILGARLNKPAFRRRMLDSGRLQASGERETGASFRPAELSRHRAAD